ncbi:YqeB family protein [Amycolatopsis anabasis]|uniref:YqeB family protein n=1 Tax=Amycolatopsis anabasis TaxID=1840409 RepID=UPI001C553340|nr:hypothetical protein [Amycolatopsis anabasis]
MAEPKWVQIGSWIICPVLGAVAGYLLRLLAGWVVNLPWVPFEGPLKLYNSIPEPARTLGAIAIGVIAGLVFAFFWAQDRLFVTISAERVGLKRGDTENHLERPAISSVFLDGKKLVFLGESGEELARETWEMNNERLREVFREHGYPWHDGGDPYAGEYKLWVEDTPDLPGSANALLKARKRAQEKRETDEAAEMRRELVKLGVVVRDDNKRQYYRLAKQN